VRLSWPLLVLLGVAFFAVLWVLTQISHGARYFGVRSQPWIILLLAAGAFSLGVSLVRAVVLWSTQASSTYLGVARSKAAGVALSVVLYVVLVVVVAGGTNLDLSGIALSGAVTGVIVGIAAQASLSNMIAGIVILFARPYRVGLFVTVRAAAFGGTEYSGAVQDITLFYTTLLDGGQEIRIPNSSMVASVVVIRPQALEVYLPVLLPLARWETLSTTGLVHQLTDALPADRQVTATVERLDESGVQIAVRASVADSRERALLERAVVQVLRAAAGETHRASDAADDLHGG
jgi:hypothetical protein